jgi:hypothetical protein
MSQSLPTIPTVGSIAAYLGVPFHRVDYIIASRGIKAIGMAGNARVFCQEDVRKIAGELSLNVAK